jgi:hypothetical protein
MFGTTARQINGKISSSRQRRDGKSHRFVQWWTGFIQVRDLIMHEHVGSMRPRLGANDDD